MKYYLDTCIWRDYFENRSDNFRPLGEWAFKLIKQIINKNDFILYSELIEEELLETYSEEDIKKILSIVPLNNMINVEISSKQTKESIKISKKLNIPRKDVLHSILARDNGAILITRDKHFYELPNQVEIRKPEDLI
jgi:predicted nucleic acid-binding protein